MKYNKAIAAVIAPVISLLVLAGLIPEAWATAEVVTGVTSALTAVAVWAIPNAE